jgi:hypothetical protein
MAGPDSISCILLAKVTVGNVFLAITAYIVFLVLKQVIYYRFFSPIKGFPGPFLGSVTRLWLSWHNVKATEIATVQALQKKYGAITTPLLMLSRTLTKFMPLYPHYADHAPRLRRNKTPGNLPSPS